MLTAGGCGRLRVGAACPSWREIPGGASRCPPGGRFCTWNKDCGAVFFLVVSSPSPSLRMESPVSASTALTVQDTEKGALALWSSGSPLVLRPTERRWTEPALSAGGIPSLMSSALPYPVLVGKLRDRGVIYLRGSKGATVARADDSVSQGIVPSLPWSSSCLCSADRTPAPTE